MTQETPDFIARHVAEIRELAPRLGAGPLSTLLAKSASIIEQLRDGLSASRVAAHAAQDEHERRVLSMQADLATLQARVEGTAAHIAVLLGAAPPVAEPPTSAWKNLPCSPHDLNELARIMPGGWLEIEWEAETSAFVIMNAWGVTPAVLEDYEWQSFQITDLGPGMHPKRPEDCFEKWPHGRRCLAEYIDDEGDFRLLAIGDVLVYADPEGTPESATFEMCQDCDASSWPDGAKFVDEGVVKDHCPICHKDGTILLMREDGVRVP